jgi:hypothetical protein
MNNVPYFLSHLPIWKANPKDKVKITKRVKEHQFDTVDKKSEDVVVKQCPVCGVKYRVSYRLRNIKKTCSSSCGHKLRNQKLKKSDDWVEDAIKMRQEGMILSNIALRVNRSITTVWKQLKLKGIK